MLISLLVCLIPTTIGGLLSAIGIAGMDRLVQHNVLAVSGRAVEAAGDVNTLLLDKTGTITLGNRQASEFLTAAGVSSEELADAAQLSSLPDETPEGRSIVVLAKEQYGLRGRELAHLNVEYIPFSALTRMSGVDMEGRSDSQGRGGCDRELPEGERVDIAGRGAGDGRGGCAAGRHAAGGGGEWPRAGRDPSEGHREGRHEGALRATARDGHQDRS